MIEFNKIKTLPELLSELKQQGIDKTEYEKYVAEFLEFKARRQGIPRHGQFEITPLCNLDCRMCYVHLNKEQMNGHDVLDESKWISIIDSAVKAGMVNATLTGGECLLHPGFEKIYMHLIDLGIQTYVLTNGVMLDRYIPMFAKYPPRGMQVTLYGCDEESYEKVTGFRNYERVVENILEARAAGIKASVSVTPSRFITAHEVIKMMDFLYERKIPFRINDSLDEPFEETGRKGRELEMPLEDYLKIMKRYIALSGSDAVERDPVELPEPGKSDGSEDNVGLRCGGGRSSFSVNWKGSMQPCLMFRQYSEDLLNQPFEDAWKKINEKCKKHIIPADCLVCEYSKVCGICPLKHKNKEGRCDLDICTKTKIMVEKGIYLLDRY